MLNVFNVFYSISETHSSTQSQIVYSTVTQCPLMVILLDLSCTLLRGVGLMKLLKFVALSGRYSMFLSGAGSIQYAFSSVSFGILNANSSLYEEQHRPTCEQTSPRPALQSQSAQRTLPVSSTMIHGEVGFSRGCWEWSTCE